MAGVGMRLRSLVLIRGIKIPFLLLEAKALTSISSIAEELGVAPVALIPTFWAEQEAHPKSFPKGRTCNREGRKNIAQSAILSEIILEPQMDDFIQLDKYLAE